MVLEPGFIEAQRECQDLQQLCCEVCHSSMVLVHNVFEIFGITDRFGPVVWTHVELFGEYSGMSWREVTAKVHGFLQVADSALLEVLGTEGFVAAVVRVLLCSYRLGLVIVKSVLE